MATSINSMIFEVATALTAAPGGLPTTPCIQFRSLMVEDSVG
jgi:hypothetical protein